MSTRSTVAVRRSALVVASLLTLTCCSSDEEAVVSRSPDPTVAAGEPRDNTASEGTDAEGADVESTDAEGADVGSADKDATAEDQGEAPAAADPAVQALIREWSAPATVVLDGADTAEWVCPAAPREVSDSLGYYRVWGTGPYTDDSAVCIAAVHQGLISIAEGGGVVVTTKPGQASYDASTANGVTTLPYGEWPASFELTAPE